MRGPFLGRAPFAEPAALPPFPSGATIEITATGQEVSGTGQAGQYADGSWWLWGTLESYTPAPQTGVVRTYTGGGSTAASDINGVALNPGSARFLADSSTLALRQAGNHGRQTSGAGNPGQPYDSLVAGTNLGYSTTMRATLPFTGQGTLVIAKSRLTGIPTSGDDTIDALTPITVVTSPPPAGAIRPPIAATDKTPILNTSQIRLSVLSSRGASVAPPTAATALSWLQSYPGIEATYNTVAQNVVAANGSLVHENYWGTIGDRWGQIMLALNSSAWTPAEKTSVITAMAPHVLDIAERVNQGGVFQPNGGWQGARKAALAIFGEIFNSDYLRAAVGVTVVGSMVGSKPNQTGSSVYGERAQLYRITKAIVDSAANAAATHPIPIGMLGWMNWGGDFSREPNFEGLSGNLLGNANSPGTNGGSNDGNYVHTVGANIMMDALALRLTTGAMATFNDPDFMEYADRYAAFLIDVEDGAGTNSSGWAAPTGTLLDGGANAAPAWARRFWSDHRGSNVALPPIPVAAGNLADLSLVPDEAMTPYDVSSDFSVAYDPDLDTVTFALAPSSDALPTGLSLSAAGVISGTPTVQVTRNIVVRATGFRGFADSAFQISVGAEVTTYVVAFMGQSQGVHVTERDSQYWKLARPTLLADGNLIIYQRNLRGVEAETSTFGGTSGFALTEANKTSVHPAFVVLANNLHHIAPGKTFVLVELYEAGTGRQQWANDDADDRIWERSADMFAEAEVAYGKIDRVCENNWTGNDSEGFNNFLKNYAPIYFGQRANGEPFDVQAEPRPRLNSDATRNVLFSVDHCLWDFKEPDPTALGQGVLRKTTKLDLQKSPGDDSQRKEDEYVAFENDARFQTLGGKRLGRALYFPGGHPDPFVPEGHFEAALDFWLPSMLLAAGYQAVPGGFTSVSVASDGSYADVIFTPACGGVLSTKRIAGGYASPAPADEPFFHQEVQGFEVRRSGEPTNQRFLFCKPGAAGIDAKYQGTVTLHATNTVRIVPVVPFANGDVILYNHDRNGARSDANHTYPNLQNTASRAFLDMPVEFVAAYQDASQGTSHNGFGVRSQRYSLTVSGVTGAPPKVWLFEPGDGEATVLDYPSRASTPAWSITSGDASATVNDYPGEP